VKSIVLWVATPCSLEPVQHYGRTSSRSKTKSGKKEADSDDKLCFLFGLLFQHEDGGDMSVRNIGVSPNYMALQTRTPCSSLGLMLVRKGGCVCMGGRWM
jgi:hypothetical protein